MVPYRLLRYANSAAFNLPREISSIAHATVMLGQRRLRDLATLLALTGVSDKPPQLTRTVLARARLCASLAPPGRAMPTPHSRSACSPASMH